MYSTEEDFKNLIHHRDNDSRGFNNQVPKHLISILPCLERKVIVQHSKSPPYWLPKYLANKQQTHIIVIYPSIHPHFLPPSLPSILPPSLPTNQPSQNKTSIKSRYPNIPISQHLHIPNVSKLSPNVPIPKTPAHKPQQENE